MIKNITNNLKKLLSNSSKQTKETALTNDAQYAKQHEPNHQHPAANIKNIAQDNPYLAARRTWNEHVGSLITSNQLWQFIALTSLMINVAAVGGLIYVGSKSKFIPYVVEVDKLGQTMVSGKILSATEADPRIMHATAAQFIQEIRLVSSDPQVQRQAVLNLYAKLTNNTTAIAKADEYLGNTPEHNPFKRAERELVNTEIRSVIQQSADTWQVEWLETIRDANGRLMGEPQIWRALVTLFVTEPNNATLDDNLRRNPLNIFVKDFSWGIVK